MEEVVSQTFGICGEHWRPSAIKITLIVLLISISARMVYKKVNQ